MYSKFQIWSMDLQKDPPHIAHTRIILMQFCATRKGTQQAANTLIKDARFVMNTQHRQRLQSSVKSLKDAKLKGKKNY